MLVWGKIIPGLTSWQTVQIPPPPAGEQVWTEISPSLIGWAPIQIPPPPAGEQSWEKITPDPNTTWDEDAA